MLDAGWDANGSPVQEDGTKHLVRDPSDARALCGAAITCELPAVKASVVSSPAPRLPSLCQACVGRHGDLSRGQRFKWAREYAGLTASQAAMIWAKQQRDTVGGMSLERWLMRSTTALDRLESEGVVGEITAAWAAETYSVDGEWLMTGTQPRRVPPDVERHLRKLSPADALEVRTFIERAYAKRGSRR
jgi:hypothetical protein